MATSSSQAESLSYYPGTIKLIKLINFMCHEAFEQRLGPRVNFIIGPNGSGKSALLTALIVALGGRATITSRARKTSDFVMYGKKFAKITVILHNYDKIMDKGLAFKPDDYGKFIVIEKEILKDDAMKLTLRNDRGKKVSDRKAELEEMLEHFGILINNPICILNQEVSKTFLHSKKPEDTFELFMKATTLENIEHHYEDAKESYKKWEDCNNRGTVGFKLLDAEYERCKEKTTALENRNKLHEQLEKITVELYWAYVNKDEEHSHKLKNEISSCRSDIIDSEQVILTKEKKLKHLEEDEQQLKANFESSLKLIAETRKKIEDINNKIMHIKSARINKNQEKAQCERQINRLNIDKKEFEKSIRDTRRLLCEQNAIDQDEEKRKSDIEFLQKEIDHLKAREYSLDNQIRQLNGSMTETLREKYSAQTHLTDLENKKATAEIHLKRLTNGKENELRRYGDLYIKLNERIDRHHSTHTNQNDPQKFSFKPIGPLGYHIKLKNPAIANPLEIHLGRNAYAYVCNNSKDMSILNKIFDEVLSGHNSRPMIIVRPFSGRHNINLHRTSHDEFKTLLDYLNIESDAIFNVCVDRCQLENILYIPNYNTAQNLLMTSSRVPQKLRCAYTEESYLMYPINSAGGYRSYANDTSKLFIFSKTNNTAIRDAQRNIELLAAEVRNADVHYNKLKESCLTQSKTLNESTEERKKVVEQLREKDSELSNLKLIIPTAKPSELAGLEEDLDTCTKSIAELQVRLEKLKLELDAIDQDITDHQSQINECNQILQEREKTKSAISQQINETRNNIDDANNTLRVKQQIITKRQAEMVELNTKLKETYAKIELGIQTAMQPRPPTLRSVEVLIDSSQRLKARIQSIEDEEMDPEEVLRNLKKRMAEIQNMTTLKDSNLSNAKLMSDSLQDREIGLVNLKKTTITAVSTTFAKVMRNMNMNGVLKIYMDPLVERGKVIKKGKTLEMNIDTNYLPTSQCVNSITNSGDIADTERSYQSQPDKGSGPRAKRARLDVGATGKENEPVIRNMTNTRSLSGGERSFSTVAFVLSLWQHCVSPFKLMDEIDVFMDMVTRRISYNALIQFAQCSSKPGQYIFFSPLELPSIDDPLSMVQVFEMPVIVRKDQSQQQT